MFDQFKAMGQVAALLRDKEKLREAGERVKARLEAVRAEGEAGGGAVRATVNGKMSLISLELAPALLSGGEKPMVEGLIIEAVNKAGEAAQERARAALDEEAREMGLPELPGGIGGLLGG